MSKETYNNLVVIMNILLIFAFVGLAIHSFYRHNDVVEGTLYTFAAVGFTG